VSHLCPARGCRFEVPDSKLMCPADWRRVPRPIQKAVTAAHANGTETALITAQQAAITAVNHIREGVRA
jgi:hypothetical protein